MGLYEPLNLAPDAALLFQAAFYGFCRSWTVRAPTSASSLARMWICFFPRCTELASVWSPCVQRSSQSTSYLLLSPMIKVLAKPGTRAIQHEKRSTHEDFCSIFVVVRELNGFRKNINTPSMPIPLTLINTQIQSTKTTTKQSSIQIF